MSGETIEPNTFAEIDSDTLMAALSGVRNGQSVSFTKTYTDAETDRICYEGQVDAAFRRITGDWHIAGHSGFRGTFTMTRASKTGQRRKRALAAT